MTVWRYEKKTKLSFLLAVVRDRLEHPVLRRKIIALYKLHAPEYLLIEDKDTRTSLVRWHAVCQHPVMLPVVHSKRQDTDEAERAKFCH